MRPSGTVKVKKSIRRTLEIGKERMIGKKKVEIILEKIRNAEVLIEKLTMLKTPLISKYEADGNVKPKIVWKLDGYVQQILYRVIDISPDILLFWRNEKLISTIILARSLMETVGAAYWLICRINSNVKKGAWTDIDNDIMKLSFGSSMIKTMPNPVNVMNFIDKVDKRIRGYRNAYEILSESTHPNSSGTLFAYSEVDPKTYDVELFDSSPKAGEWLNQNMPSVVTNSLILMQLILNDYNEIRPNIINGLNKHITDLSKK
jgi:hypothetical protein